MNTNVFVVYILTLACGATYFYARVKEHFNPLVSYQKKVEHLEKKVKDERFQHLLTSYEFHDFRAYVGTILPSAIEEKGPGEKSYPLRTLASVVQKQNNEKVALSRAKNIFEEGKTLFRGKQYESAINSFRVLLKNHPYSPHVPEALFLLVESYFVQRQYDSCITYANQMLDIYPENELTAYALMRLGKIYEFQDRHDDAIEIYKTVLKVFPQRGIASLASGALRAVEL